MLLMQLRRGHFKGVLKTLKVSYNIPIINREKKYTLNIEREKQHNGYQKPADLMSVFALCLV